MSINIAKEDHIQGLENAPVELLEYADFQCPYCRQAYPVIKQIQQKMSDKLKFIFRNFPIPELHQYAVHAAIAAEVAGAHGKFWEMHDKLFENQQHLTDDNLIRYAEEIGIDPKQFEQDFSNEKFMQKVQSDYDSGIKNGVQGTPAFFINGKQFAGNWMTSELIDYLESLV